MGRTALLIVLMLAAGRWPVAGTETQGAGGNNWVEGEVLVTFRPSHGLAEARQLLGRRSMGLARHFAHLSQFRGRQTVLVRAPQRATASLLSELAQDPAVETVEPNYLRRVFGGAPRDPLFDRLWGLQNTGQYVNGVTGVAGRDIRFLDAWALRRPSTEPVVVAVVDSGVYYQHPDLAANMWVNTHEIPSNGIDDDFNGYVDDYYGFNFLSWNSDPSDSGEHGTHVAGTIAAAGDNDVGIVGVDGRARIMALRTSDDGETMPDSATIAAIEYAVMMKQSGVNVVAINASYGGEGSSTTERAAIEAAGNAGIVFCAAAGNEASDNDAVPTYPAGYRLPNMIVVAASNQSDALAGFSNYGVTTVDLAAPGVNILSTVPPGLTSYVHTAEATYVGDEFEFAGTTTGISGTIYDCGLGYPQEFPAAVQGNIALISRGMLYFTDKVANAMAAGATAAIIFNNTNGAINGTLQYPSNWIPAVALTEMDGLLLKARLPIAGTVFNALDPTPTYAYHEGTSMATPHVSGAVAFAAMNFPNETASARVQRVLAGVDPVAGLAGKVRTGGRLNMLRIVDRDANTLPDWWEQAMFGGATGVNPNDDPDQDGLTTWQEFEADTDPLDPGSRLRLTTVQTLANGVRVNWTGGVESIVYLERTATPDAPDSWEVVFTNPVPASVTASILDPFTNRAAFYRLRAERP